MAILHGDILLTNSGDIQGTADGDLASGDATEQQTGAILNASAGNFRKYPTLGANLAAKEDAPNNTRAVVLSVKNSLYLDGWKAEQLRIDTTADTLQVFLDDVTKITDDTKALY